MSANQWKPDDGQGETSSKRCVHNDTYIKEEYPQKEDSRINL